MHRHEFELPAEDIAAFQRDGALCVRQLFTAPEVELLTRGIQKNLDAPSPRARWPAGPTIPAGSSRTSATGGTTTNTGDSSSTAAWARWPRS